MTVTYLGELHSARQAENNLGKRSYTRAFLLEADSRADGAYTVGSHASLPTIGAAHPDDAAAFCSTITITNHAPWKGWTATYKYTTDRQWDPTTPANDEVLVSFDSEIYQAPIFQDTSGEAIVNSAGDYFIDPAPTRDGAHIVAKINANVATVPAWVLSYNNAVNNAAVTIAGLTVAIRTGKVQRISVSERQKRGASTFYSLSYEVHILGDGTDWRLRPLDAGFREKTDTTKRKQIKNDGDGEEPTTPVPLNGSGAFLANPTPATAVFGDFTVYPELDLTALPGDIVMAQYVLSEELHEQVRKTVQEMLRGRRSDERFPGRWHKRGVRKPIACILDGALAVATDAKTGAASATATVCEWDTSTSDYSELTRTETVWNHSESLAFATNTFGVALWVDGHWHFSGDCEAMAAR